MSMSKDDYDDFPVTSEVESAHWTRKRVSLITAYVMTRDGKTRVIPADDVNQYNWMLRDGWKHEESR